MSVHFVGLQEAQTEEGYSLSRNLTRFSSGHAGIEHSKSLGVESWICHDVPVSVKDHESRLTKSFVNQMSAKQIFFDPRFQLTSFSICKSTVYHLNVHAPHANLGLNVYRNLFKDIEAQLKFSRFLMSF